MQQAVLLGIINNQQGLYVDSKRQVSMPIPEAMNQGFIKVEFSTTRKSKEKLSDVGLMTIKTQRESRHYTLVGVIDWQSGQHLSVDDAIQAGMLDQQRGVYCQAGGREMSLAEALDAGYLLAEMDADAPDESSEAVSKTYAIHSVQDQRSGEMLPFSRAVASGLLNRDTGAYFHSALNQHMFVGEAIKHGFVRAELVDNPAEFDISPENRLVVDTVSSIRRKLINPLRTIAAFRFAADQQHHTRRQTQQQLHVASTQQQTSDEQSLNQPANADTASDEQSLNQSANADTAGDAQSLDQPANADTIRSLESIMTSGYSSQEIPTSEASATEVQTNQAGATEIQANQAGATDIQTNQGGATEVQTNQAGATEIPTSEASATKIPAKRANMTKIPTKRASATKVLSEEASATDMSSSSCDPMSSN